MIRGLLAWVALTHGAHALGAQDPFVVLATTTSVRDAGLLDSLLPPFEAETGIQVRVVAVGSGQAMELGRRGEADLVILHDPPREGRFIAAGFGIDRRPLMSNEFLLVGPPDDPAGARGLAITTAFARVAERGALFVSRGDQSGTNARERHIWDLVGIEPVVEWYRESGQGMGATLVIADQLSAYTLVDVGTWLARRAALSLGEIAEGDSILVNPYHVIRINPRRHAHVHAVEALVLADYLTSDVVQARIGAFRRQEFGRSLFRPARIP